MCKSPSRHISFRKIVLLVMSIIVIPLFAAVSLFDIYTIKSQRDAAVHLRLNTLSAYQAQIEDTVQTAEAYLQSTVANNLDFQSIIYARTKTEAYAASELLAKNMHSLLQSNRILGGCYTYSMTFDHYRPNNIASYPGPDANIIRQSIIDAAGKENNVSEWQPIRLSDRTVLLCTAVFKNTVVAALLDPGELEISALEENNQIFSVLPDGSPYAKSEAFSNVPIAESPREPLLIHDMDGNRYDAVYLPLSSIGGYIVYAAPSVSLLQQTSVKQKALLLITIGLLVSIPVCWLMFRRFLLEPLESLTDTMHSIRDGNTEIRVPQKSQIKEVNDIAQTVNTMLDLLEQHKISSYEQQLETEHAQLQYYQLQIRPHFYLNCLNIIYSLSEEKKYKAIQELVLDLSSYLRGMFKDISSQVTLRSELHSVESFMRIMNTGSESQASLSLDVDADVVEELIPPLCILTFVENCFKHRRFTEIPLFVHIKCSRLSGEADEYLNITICDNCGGIPDEQLRRINGSSMETPWENHVGIFNVKQRLRLLYADRAALTIKNQAGGACVDLFIPANNESGGCEAIQTSFDTFDECRTKPVKRGIEL